MRIGEEGRVLRALHGVEELVDEGVEGLADEVVLRLRGVVAHAVRRDEAEVGEESVEGGVVEGPDPAADGAEVHGLRHVVQVVGQVVHLQHGAVEDPLLVPRRQALQHVQHQLQRAAALEDVALRLQQLPPHALSLLHRP